MGYGTKINLSTQQGNHVWWILWEKTTECILNKENVSHLYELKETTFTTNKKWTPELSLLTFYYLYLDTMEPKENKRKNRFLSSCIPAVLNPFVEKIPQICSTPEVEFRTLCDFLVPERWASQLLLWVWIKEKWHITQITDVFHRITAPYMLSFPFKRWTLNKRKDSVTENIWYSGLHLFLYISFI